MWIWHLFNRSLLELVRRMRKAGQGCWKWREGMNEKCIWERIRVVVALRKQGTGDREESRIYSLVFI